MQQPYSGSATARPAQIAWLDGPFGIPSLNIPVQTFGDQHRSVAKSAAIAAKQDMLSTADFPLSAPMFQPTDLVARSPQPAEPMLHHRVSPVSISTCPP